MASLVVSPRLGRWYFDAQVLGWGNQVLKNCLPCDLLVIDELGPLEFNRQIGLTAAFNVLPERRYKIGCVVIRPSLLAEAQIRWPWEQTIDISETSVRKLLASL